MKSKRISAAVTAVLLALSCPAGISASAAQTYSISQSAVNFNVSADGAVTAKPIDNLRFSKISNTFIAAVDGGYMRVICDGEKVYAEYFDSNFSFQSSRTLELELPIWGGFFKGSDAYYLIEGQNNMEEDNAAEFTRVIKYDFDWNRIGSAKVSNEQNLWGGKTRLPFNYGNVSAAESNGMLYFATGHEGYVDEAVGQGHQGMLLVAVNEADMTAKIIDSDFWHSFSQSLVNDNGTLYLLEESEGSGVTTLTKYIPYEERADETKLSVFQYGGSRESVWSTATYASADDIAVSENNILGLGTSIDQSQYDNYDYNTTAYNIYLTVTPKENFTEDATQVKWLTNHENDGNRFKWVNITKIDENRFLVMWQELSSDGNRTDSNDSLSVSRMHYLYVDGNGDKLSEESTVSVPLSQCQPIFDGQRVVYTASNDSQVSFYCVDTEKNTVTSKVIHALDENTPWEYSSGKLTVGNVEFSVSENVMTVKNNDQTRDGDLSLVSNVDRSILSELFDGVTTVNIETGFKDIPSGIFSNRESLKEVYISEGTESIGERAFYGNQSLEKITIPKSVTSIGEDILWTGYLSWFGEDKIVYATIYGVTGSTAETYANENNIQFIDTANKNSDSSTDTEKLTDTDTFTETDTEEITDTDNTVPEDDTDENTDTEWSGETVILGDINNDGVVDSYDSMRILRHSTDVQPLPEKYEAAADVNGDGIINSADALIVLRYSVKLYVENTTVGSEIRLP